MTLIIDSVHVKLLHAGINSTVTAIRQEYWIPTVRQYIKSVLRHCMTCWRLQGKPYIAPDPTPLPQSRTQDAPSFSVTRIKTHGSESPGQVK